MGRVLATRANARRDNKDPSSSTKTFFECDQKMSGEKCGFIALGLSTGRVRFARAMCDKHCKLLASAECASLGRSRLSYGRVNPRSEYSHWDILRRASALAR